MPYQGEYASKSSHYDIIQNPDVTQFLEECEYLTAPSAEETAAISARFVEPPPLDDIELPERVIAIDGTDYESEIKGQLPNSRVGYVKLGAVLIDLQQYHSLRVSDDRFVDPQRVAKLQESNSPLTFTLPSANIRWRGEQSVRDGFRGALDSQLYAEKTRFNATDAGTSLRSTLFHLASRRPIDKLGTGDPKRLKIHKCPTCKKEQAIELLDIPGPQHCKNCSNIVYPSDCLRLWEEVSDYQSNKEALSRFMIQAEHMLSIHYIRYLAENSLPSLGDIAFFIDGPLAVFGNGAWLMRPIMHYLSEVNALLRAKNLPTILMIGLQKNGQVVDHVNLIERYIEPNRIYAIDDDYRYQYIKAGRDAANVGFGDETYYGQDFIYKTPSGRVFVFALPYPTDDKRDPTPTEFHQVKKIDMNWYPELPRALALINHFESDLYENAVVPVALAHHYTAISLVPGGKVLDLLTRKALKVRS